jgi:hypothetical protein
VSLLADVPHAASEAETMNAVFDVETGEVLRGDWLPALPEDPTNYPAVKLANLCKQVYEHRDEIVGGMDAESAFEAARRMRLIEQYVRNTDQKDAARRAARVLETAIGQALPDAEQSQKSGKPLTHGLKVIPPMDRSRFRLMSKYREVWWPALQEKPLSLKQVLRLIDFARHPRAVGLGSATIVHADAIEWLAAVPEADLLLTDPPYSTDVDDIHKFVLSWLPLALSRLKPTARAFVFIGAYAEELGAYFSTTLPDGWQWSVPHAWVYRNTIGPTPDRDFVRNWQCVLTARGPEAPSLQTSRITELLAGFVENAPDGRQEVKHHRWQKPLELAQRFIRLTTPNAGVVIDPFSGSGTHLLAAKAEGCHGTGCDVDSEAVATALERGCDAG